MTVRGGNTYIATGKGKAAPGGAVDHLIMKADPVVIQRLLTVAVVARQDLTTQRADLTGHAIGDTQLVRTKLRALALAGQRLRQLVDQASHHSRRSDQPLIEGKHHLLAQVAQHPGSSKRPDHDKCRAENQAQA